MASKSPPSKTLETLQFDNQALRRLPLDKEADNFVRQVPDAIFSRVTPTPVERPRIVAFSPEAMRLLDLGPEEMAREEAAQFFGGNRLLKGSESAAHCYCGHQFGYFSGQLGDGAAMYLGEVVNTLQQRWEIQLKGAGPTPYSRQADGRKVLRSSLREFLCSEAMFHLGIPTTRAGCLVTSDSTVTRDMFYDGHPKDERCSLVLRIAETFIRFGSFEICKPEDEHTGRKGPSVANKEILGTLLNYVIEMFYPEIWKRHEEPGHAMYLAFYREIVERTARLVADWQCVGFCHGVLNTDNMSIFGLTIDYGPFGFMDRFDPNFVCNSSDDGARYTYAKQPEICRWNCERLAHSLKDLVPVEETLKVLLEAYQPAFDERYLGKMRAKLGLLQEKEEADRQLVEQLLSTMQQTGADFTNTFRALGEARLDFGPDLLDRLLAQCASAEELRSGLQPGMADRDLYMLVMMAQANPGLLQAMGRAGARLQREIEVREKLQEMKDLTDSAKRDKDRALWSSWLEAFRARLQRELASAEAGVGRAAAEAARRQSCAAANPRVVLRNHLAELAIRAAEEGDYGPTRELLAALRSSLGAEEACEAGAAPVAPEASYEERPPTWAAQLRVS